MTVKGYRGIGVSVVVLLEHHGHIYIGVHDQLGAQVKARINPTLLTFLVQPIYSTSPRSHNVATQTVRLKKNPKTEPTDIPTTVVTVDASQSCGWSGNQRGSQAGGSPSCRCRGSRERRVVKL